MLVALAMAAVMVTTLMELILLATRNGTRTRARAELGHTAAVTTQVLRNDLAYTGLGVPSAREEASTARLFGTAVLVAAPTALGILGDLPRPDANFSTMGFLVDDDAGGGHGHHVSWYTENSGHCLVGTSQCSTADFSQFFPGEAGCRTEAEAELPHRTCPWGLKRLRGGEPFQVVAGNRRWFSAPNKDPMEFHSHGKGNYVHTGNNFPSGWSADSATSLPNAGAGQGWVTTLDRVFWRHDATARTLERIQCWGAPDPTSSSWPAGTATSAPATPCASPFQGMGAYEVVARDVQSVQWRYFDAAGTELTSPDTTATKASVRRIEYRIVFARDAAGARVQHEVVGGVFLPTAI